jgi:hypothetical protein
VWPREERRWGRHEEHAVPGDRCRGLRVVTWRSPHAPPWGKIVSSLICFKVPKGIFNFSQVYVVEELLPNMFGYFLGPPFLSGVGGCMCHYTFHWISVKYLQRPGYIFSITTVCVLSFFRLSHSFSKYLHINAS